MTSEEQARRLSALREEMANEGIAALIVPRADEVQGEYVAPSSERLAFISGFTGSAGFAAIGRDAAALFVDGRYTIQVRNQSAAAFWEHRHILDAPFADWAKAALVTGDRIGFDPKLHTPGQIRQMTESLAGLGLSLVPLKRNLVDAIWSDRPAEPTGDVFLYPPELAGESAPDKRRRLARELADNRLDASVVSAPDNLAWLFNIRGSDVAMLPVAFGTAIVTADGAATLFMAPGKLTPEVRAAIAEGGQVDIRDPADVGGTLAGLGGRRVRVDRATGSVAVVDALKEAGADVDVGADPITLMKAVKNETELQGMRAAHRRDAVAMVRFLHWFGQADPEGLTEWTAGERLEDFRRAGNQYRGPSFSTIAASAGNAAQAHYHAGPSDARQLRRDEIFLVDSGGQYLDGTTDITRVLVTGVPSAEMKRRYTQVLKGHIALSRARFPAGVTGAQLDTFARQYLWASGVDFDHGTGHGVGCYLSVHEGPQSISKRGTEVALKPGMVVSNEPGYYKADAFGIRIENLLAVTVADPQPDGAERQVLAFETLTFVPYERALIETGLLDAEERAFVDAYHGEVRRRLAEADLSPAERQFLETATAPLSA